MTISFSLFDEDTRLLFLNGLLGLCFFSGELSLMARLRRAERVRFLPEPSAGLDESRLACVASVADGGAGGSKIFDRKSRARVCCRQQHQ